MSRLLAAALLAAWACGAPDPATEGAPPSYAPPDVEPPVALNPDPPIQYPPALFDQKIEGDVVLRLFVDSTGRLARESTRVAESSGYPALDSAALVGAVGLDFAPARRRGVPVATAFLQPIEFRHPGTSGTPLRGEPAPATPAPRPAAPAPRRRPDTTAARPGRDTTARDTTPPAQPADTSAAPR